MSRKIISIGSLIVFASTCNASGLDSEKYEVSIACATAMSVAVVDFQKKEGPIKEGGEFGKIACVQRGGSEVEVIFVNKNPRARGGGVHYEISKEGNKILKVRQTR